MPANIKNSTSKLFLKSLSNEPVFLRFNSGVTVHIAPRQISGEFTEGDILNNHIIQKLLDRRVISVERQKEETKSSMKSSPKEETKSSMKSSP